MSADRMPEPFPATANSREARKARRAKSFRLFARTVMEKVPARKKRHVERIKMIDGKRHRLHPTRGWKVA